MYLVDPELIAENRDRSLPPVRTVLDMAVDDVREVTIDGHHHRIELKGIEDRRDGPQGALSDSRVRLVIDNDWECWITCGTYHLPRSIAGIRIDCLATSTYVKDSDHNKWGLSKDALLRLWPAEGPLMPGGCQYPLLGEWMHSQTQIASETLYVNGYVSEHGFYYHAPIDIGGIEGEPVVAVNGGLLLAVGTDVLPGSDGIQKEAHEDVIILLDGRGWIHKYAHLRMLNPALSPGQHIVMGEMLGELGKNGSSGGWSHLHYKVIAQMPSGQWGNEDMYAYLLDAWTRDNDVDLVACARPHRAIHVGERVVLSAINTWAAEGADLDFIWTMPDGSPAFGREVIWKAENAGTFTATVQVEDGRGNSDRDNATIQVIDPGVPTLTLHAALWPCNRVRVGEEVRVAIRSFNNSEAGGEMVDFGDTSDPVAVRSDGGAELYAEDGYAIAKHTYYNSGQYLIEISCVRSDGQTATAHLTVVVE